MFNTLFNLTNIFGAGHGSSFLSAGYLITFFLNLFSKVINFLMQILWVILKFIFGVMEAFEYMIHSFLGIGVKLSDMEDYASELKVGSRYYLDIIVDVFRAVVGAALVLMIVFTIIAIVKQEWENAHNGFEEPKKKGVGNNKGEIIARMFKNIRARRAT